MTIVEFNQHNDLPATLRTTCGSSSWVEKMVSLAPFSSLESILTNGNRIWKNCSSADWMEAYKHHPEIGNMDSLREKYSSARNLSEAEQSEVEHASEQVLQELSRQNKAYKEKFDFIFIVFATGKSAKEMLDLLNSRINNSKQQEIENAMEEQWKITKLRLQKLLS